MATNIATVLVEPLQANKTLKMLSNYKESPGTSLAVLLVFSLLVKAALIYQADIINIDGIRYINSAHELFQGNVAAAFAHEKMLGFTFLLGLTHLMIPDWFLAGKVLSCIALVLATIPLYLIAQELFGRRAAFCSALVFSVIPSINEKCTSVLKDPFFLFLILLSLWFVLYAYKESRWGYSLTAGLLCCLSVLIRPEGLVFFVVITLSLVISIAFMPEDRSLNLKQLLAFCVLPFGALLLIAILFASGMAPLESLPKIYERFAHYFKTDPLQTYRSIYQHLGDVEENFSGGLWTNDFFEYARYNIFIIYLVGMLQTFFKALFPVFLLPFFFGLNLRNRCNRQVLLFLTVLVSFFLMGYAFLITNNFLSARYLLVPVTLCVVLVGYGMDRIITSIDPVRHRRVAFFVALIFCLMLPLGKSFSKGTGEKMEVKQAGIWLRDNRDITKNRIILTEERVAYYAGLLRGEYDTLRNKRINRFEKAALQGSNEIIVIYINKNDIDKIPAFKEFSLVEKIDGSKKIVMIYERKADG